MGALAVKGAAFTSPQGGGNERMKLHDYPETNALYIDLNSQPD